VDLRTRTVKTTWAHTKEGSSRHERCRAPRAARRSAARLGFVERPRALPSSARLQSEELEGLVDVSADHQHLRRGLSVSELAGGGDGSGGEDASGASQASKKLSSSRAWLPPLHQTGVTPLATCWHSDRSAAQGRALNVQSDFTSLGYGTHRVLRCVVQGYLTAAKESVVARGGQQQRSSLQSGPHLRAGAPRRRRNKRPVPFL